VASRSSESLRLSLPAPSGLRCPFASKSASRFFACTCAILSSLVPAPICRSPVPAGPHWPVKVGVLEFLVPSNRRLFLVGEADALWGFDVSLPKRLEAISCREDHEDSQKPAANAVEPVCDPNRLGALNVELLLLDVPTSWFEAAVLEGYLLGIGDASRNEDMVVCRAAEVKDLSSCNSESPPS